jgi:hypothetical protein
VTTWLSVTMDRDARPVKRVAMENRYKTAHGLAGMLAGHRRSLFRNWFRRGENWSELRVVRPDCVKPLSNDRAMVVLRSGMEPLNACTSTRPLAGTQQIFGYTSVQD